MKKISIIIVSLFFAVNISAQTETRELTDFSGLKISNALEVVLVQGNENKLVITATEEESLNKVKSEVENGILILSLKKQLVKKVKRNGKSVKTKSTRHIKGSLKIVLTFKHINDIKISGASEISTLGVIRQKELKIKGGGAIEEAG